MLGATLKCEKNNVLTVSYKFRFVSYNFMNTHSMSIQIEIIF